MKFEKVWDLVTKLEKMGLRSSDWFQGDGENVVSKQSSVVRTNCMDW